MNVGIQSRIGKQNHICVTFSSVGFCLGREYLKITKITDSPSRMWFYLLGCQRNVIGCKEQRRAKQESKREFVVKHEMLVLSIYLAISLEGNEIGELGHRREKKSLIRALTDLPFLPLQEKVKPSITIPYICYYWNDESEVAVRVIKEISTQIHILLVIRHFALRKGEQEDGPR